MPMVRRRGHDLELPMLLPPNADGRNDEPPATSDIWRRSAEVAESDSECPIGPGGRVLLQEVDANGWGG